MKVYRVYKVLQKWYRKAKDNDSGGHTILYPLGNRSLQETGEFSEIDYKDPSAIF